MHIKTLFERAYKDQQVAFGGSMAPRSVGTYTKYTQRTGYCDKVGACTLGQAGHVK